MNYVTHLIENHLPETDILNRKDRLPARRCREDCAVLDARDPDRMLAFRGRIEPCGALFSSAFGVSGEDMHFLRAHSTECRPLLLGGSHAPLLILNDLTESAGVLLALSPRLDGAAFLRALTEQGLSPLLAPSLQGRTGPAHQADPLAAELVSEWFFYLTRIFSPRSPLGLCTRGMLIANFTGCHTESVGLPVSESTLSSNTWQRVAAFLLCVFLTLRRCNGTICAHAGGESADAPTLRVSLDGDAEQTLDNLCELSDAPFLSHPAFRDFRILRTRDGICMEAVLPDIEASAALRTSHCRQALRTIRLFFSEETLIDTHG